MRRITAGAAATLAAALLCTAWWWPTAGQALAATRPGATPSTPPASTAACYAFAVSALRHRVVVRRIPPACAGLPAAQLNQAVDRAIRTVAGPLPKAAARRKDRADSRYLASLIRQGRPPRPEALAVGAAATSGTLVPRLAALAVWLAAALAGGYLLTGRSRRRSPRPVRALGVAGAHAGLAVAGLCVWIAFIATAVPALGWIDVVLTWVIVGLGIATLLSGSAVNQPGPELVPATLAPAGPAPPGSLPAASLPAASLPASSAPARAPVLMIALHGTLATATIVLVLLAVTGTS